MERPPGFALPRLGQSQAAWSAFVPLSADRIGKLLRDEWVSARDRTFAACCPPTHDPSLRCPSPSLPAGPTPIPGAGRSVSRRWRVRGGGAISVGPRMCGRGCRWTLSPRCPRYVCVRFFGGGGPLRRGIEGAKGGPAGRLGRLHGRAPRRVPGTRPVQSSPPERPRLNCQAFTGPRLGTTALVYSSRATILQLLATSLPQHT
ncbi:hypothetical protein CRENBAI_024000 [Crenichthys baileyi]|uniref:Uncharacterized protein n=1 Tax=Crenichthys baileyi TaxID=28760 RepID=A0AAV9RPH5_9TELE